jgi:hypothetical protein
MSTHLNVGSRDEFRVHPVRHAKDRLAKVRFGRLEAAGHLRQVPHGLYRGLGHHRLSRRMQYLAVRLETTRGDRFATFCSKATVSRQSVRCQLVSRTGCMITKSNSAHFWVYPKRPRTWEVNMGLRHSNCWAYIPTLLEPVPVMLRRQVPERVKDADLVRLRPRGVGSNLEDGGRQRQIGHVVRIELTGSQRQARVHAVRTLVRADGVPLRRVPDCANDRAADSRVRMAPANWDRVDAERI